MPRSTWLLLRHQADIQVASLHNQSDLQNPQADLIPSIDWSTIAATYTIPCRYMPRSLREQAEIARFGLNVVSSHVLFLQYDSAPDSLRDLDSVPDPSTYHRVVNIRDETGTIVEIGPLNIVHIINPGGANKLLVLALQKVN